jgi:hypothetical protein
MMEGTEEKHEILQLIQAVWTKLCNTALANTSFSFCFPNGNARAKTVSKIVAVTSLSAASDEAS